MVCFSLTATASAGVFDEAAPAPPGADAEPVLFECVRYVDKHETACCSVPMVIAVNDPCYVEPECHCGHACGECGGCGECSGCSGCGGCGECDCCKCEAPEHPQVHIEICVPKCYCEEDMKVTTRRNGDLVRYDFGKYAVDVRVRRGFIVVDYQD